MIAFSGLDGAGKSTQIDNIKCLLVSKGIQVEVFWSRGGYTPGMELVKRLFQKEKVNNKPTDVEKSHKRAKAFNNSVVRKIWLGIAILDLLLFYSIILRLKSIRKTIICDRYLFDTALDFTLNFPQEEVNKWGLWRFLELTALTPKHHFVITIPVVESQRRSKLKKEPFPDSAEVLQFRLEKYVLYCNQNSNVYHIDGSRPISFVSKDILDILQL